MMALPLKGDDHIKPAWAYYTDMMWNFFLHRIRYHDQNGTQQLHFRTDIDKLNWDTCQRVWDGMTEREREIQMLVYCTSYEATPEAIRAYAKQHGLQDIDVWRVSAACGRRLAVERGLTAPKKGGEA